MSQMAPKSWDELKAKTLAGNPDAQNRLCVCLSDGRGYYQGVGVRPDPFLAVRYFRKAIASRNITQWDRELAMFWLGACPRSDSEDYDYLKRFLYWKSIPNALFSSLRITADQCLLNAHSTRTTCELVLLVLIT
jgi:TPR repeat protein